MKWFSILNGFKKSIQAKRIRQRIMLLLSCGFISACYSSTLGIVVADNETANFIPENVATTNIVERFKHLSVGNVYCTLHEEYVAFYKPELSPFTSRTNKTTPYLTKPYTEIIYATDLSAGGILTDDWLYLHLSTKDKNGFCTPYGSSVDNENQEEEKAKLGKVITMLEALGAQAKQ